MTAERYKDLTRRLSRRRLLGSGVAAGLFAGAAAFADSPPKQGGALRLALTHFGPTDWDLAGAHGTYLAAVMPGAIHDTLTEVTATGALVGELAERWDSSPDAQSWTFHLRPNAVFSDGHALAPEDVAASFEHHAATPCAITSQIASVEPVGRHAVRFDLIGGNTDFPYLLSDPRLVVYPSQGSGRAVRTGTGTGLYSVTSGDLDSGLRLKRRLDHYKDGQAGWFDVVEVVPQNDHAARVDLLSRGDVDAIDAIDPTWGRTNVHRPKFKMVSVASDAHIRLRVTGPKAAVALGEVLRAALDRQTMVREILNGQGAEAADLGFGRRNGPFWDGPGLASPSVLGSEIKLNVAEAFLSDPVALRTAKFVASTLSQLGASVRFGPARSDEASVEVLLEPAPLSAETALGVLSDERLSAARLSGQSALKSETFASLLREQAAASPDIIPVFADYSFAHSPRIGHVGRIGKTLTLDSARIAERWWRV